MNQITVRRVKYQCVEKAKLLAKEEGVSLNAVYAQAIAKGLGIVPSEKTTNGLEVFAGDSDFGEEWDGFLQGTLKEIDKEIWS